jgi:hypothetical protein
MAPAWQRRGPAPPQCPRGQSPWRPAARENNSMTGRRAAPGSLRHLHPRLREGSQAINPRQNPLPPVGPAGQEVRTP